LSCPKPACPAQAGPRCFSEARDHRQKKAGSRVRGALIGDSGYVLEGEEKLVAAFLGRRADGIVLSNVEHTARTRSLLSRARLPVVETGNLTGDPIDMVVGF